MLSEQQDKKDTLVQEEEFEQEIKDTTHTATCWWWTKVAVAVAVAHCSRLASLWTGLAWPPFYCPLCVKSNKRPFHSLFAIQIVTATRCTLALFFSCCFCHFTHFLLSMFVQLYKSADCHSGSPSACCAHSCNLFCLQLVYHQSVWRSSVFSCVPSAQCLSSPQPRVFASLYQAAVISALERGNSLLCLLPFTC